MLNCKVFGLGAAGNKAAIEAIKQGAINQEDCFLINSTLRDIPEEYRQFAIELEGSNGCAKERQIAAAMMEANLSSNDALNAAIDRIAEDDSFVIIVASAEGGTGSGSSSVLSKFILEEFGIPVHMMVLCGFEDDARGMNNTIELIRELSQQRSNGIIVSTISNKKFLLDADDSNKRRAEKKANDEFCQRVKIIRGLKLKDSDDNIDEMDLRKITTTGGYMEIVHGEFNKGVKNAEEFNKELRHILDKSKSYATKPSAIRSAVIVSRSPKIADNLSDGLDLITEYYGEAAEKFTHTQDSDVENYIDIIISGMKYPVDAIQDIYNEFQATYNRVDQEDDEFESSTVFNMSMGNFDMGKRNKPAGRRLAPARDPQNRQPRARGAFTNTKATLIEEV